MCVCVCVRIGKSSEGHNIPIIGTRRSHCAYVPII